MKKKDICYFLIIIIVLAILLLKMNCFIDNSIVQKYELERSKVFFEEIENNDISSLNMLKEIMNKYEK